MTKISSLKAQTPQKQLVCLIVDDDPGFAGGLGALVRKSCIQNGGVYSVATIGEADAYLKEQRVDVCFLSFELMAAEGLTNPMFMEWRAMMTAFIFLSAAPHRDSALQALGLGAKDFLGKKSLNEFIVAKTVSYALFSKYRELELEAVALRDNVTGLKNKALFEEHLHHTLDVARRGKERVGVLMIGIDGIEPIKEDYGDQVADELLKEVAIRISNSLRISDVVARLDDYEFGAVLEKVDSGAIVSTLSGKVSGTISNKPYQVAGYSLKIDAFVGETIFPNDASTPSGLMYLATKKKQIMKRRKGEIIKPMPVGYFG